ncbi:MAG TPA: PLP-dependent aminotransferase family protein [Actinomycetota bacterium]|nr:PLP-dependent aminotransferase family protein [Actinomycetota bacterium]
MTTASDRRLLQVLGDWMKHSGPLYARLATAFTLAIEQLDLPPGTKLPAERNLAALLAVSRATVTQAYETLRDGGWVQSRQGSGTWVGSTAQSRSQLVPAGPRPLTSGSFYHRLVDSSPQSPINLAMAALSDTEEIFREDLAFHLEDMLAAPNHGYAPLGYQPLRQMIAGLFQEEGAPTLPEEIIVTSGAQQAISLLACHYLQRGDAVVVESPTYAGAIDAFSRAGARLIPVPVGPSGIRIDLLTETLYSAKPRLVYLMPTYQNPTGAVMPDDARREIARLADQSQVPFAEDNTLADISLGGHEPPPPLAHYAQGGTVISIGSMSKLYWAGLRVGWIRAPESLITRLGQHKAAADLGSSLVSQAIACRLLPDQKAVRARRGETLRLRLDALERLLGERLPEWRWRRPEGGLSLWVRIPTSDAHAFAEQALRHGVALNAGTSLTPDDLHQDHIRLNFVVPEELLEAAVDRLAVAWKAHRSAGGPQLEAVEVKV